MKKFLIFLLLASCMVGPNHRDLDPVVPEKYSEEYRFNHGEVNLAEWWKQFDDPLLSELIELALIANYDLEIACEKITELRGLYRIAASKLWPEIDGVGSAQRERRSENTFNEIIFGPLIQNLFQLGFDASWEIDLFGKTRRSKEAASYDVKSAIEQARDVQITVCAEVARSYVDICALQEQIAVIEREILAAEEIADLAQVRFESGLISEIEWQNTISLLDAIRATLPPLIAARQAVIYGLAVLLGELPESLDSSFAANSPIPFAEGKIPEGLPSQLLKRRPDIREADANVDAARARIGVAKADLFPQFSLTGSWIYESNFQNNWLTPGSRTWSIMPGFSWPIFTGGRILGQIDVRDSQYRQALLTYEKIVLQAFKDVETTLVAYAEEHRKERALAGEVKADRREEELTRDLYTSGLVALSQVLDIEKQLLEAEAKWIVSRQTLMNDLIAVYKSLGGGWSCSSMP